MVRLQMTKSMSERGVFGRITNQPRFVFFGIVVGFTGVAHGFRENCRPGR